MRPNFKICLIFVGSVSKDRSIMYRFMEKIISSTRAAADKRDKVGNRWTTTHHIIVSEVAVRFVVN